MSIFKTFEIYIFEVCYHGKQRAAVLMSRKNTEDTVFAYALIYLDYKVALTK